MAERTLEGLPAAPGSAVGRARVLAGAAAVDREPVPRSARQAEIAAARDALDRAAAEIDAIAVRLKEAGRDEDAEIVQTGTLIARDPSLHREVLAAVFEHGAPAAAAILDASEAQASLVAALDDERLAERADDIRSVGRRAAGLVGSGSRLAENGHGARVILIAEDLGPAEVAELEGGVTGIALAAGGVSAHAAIVARSLGIPMVVGLGDEVLGAGPGTDVVVDGGGGVVFLFPAPGRVEAVRMELGRRDDRRARAIASRELASVTRDGHVARVLANVSGTAEVDAALEAGAEGVGLLRTELAFLDAAAWPTEADHRRVLAPILAKLEGRPATVRVLDFGGDKTPPFLAGVEARGIELLLAHPGAFAAQLRAIVATATNTQLRVLLPMVGTVEQVAEARRAILAVADAVPGAARPLIGAMIETAEGVEAARAIASNVDFLSIGTNDLTHSIMRSDRFAPQAVLTHNPRVLRAIAVVVDAAMRAEVPLEICGEAASEPLTAPLLIGAGVDELSVGAARVGTVREWIRSLSFAEVSDLEARARRLETAAQVEALVAGVAQRLSLLEGADADGEVLERPVGVVAVGAEPQGRPAPGAQR